MTLAACHPGPVVDLGPKPLQADGTISGTVRGPEGTSAIEGRDGRGRQRRHRRDGSTPRPTTPAVHLQSEARQIPRRALAARRREHRQEARRDQRQPQRRRRARRFRRRRCARLASALSARRAPTTASAPQSPEQIRAGILHPGNDALPRCVLASAAALCHRLPRVHQPDAQPRSFDVLITGGTHRGWFRRRCDAVRIWRSRTAASRQSGA